MTQLDEDQLNDTQSQLLIAMWATEDLDKAKVRIARKLGENVNYQELHKAYQHFEKYQAFFSTRTSGDAETADQVRYRRKKT